MKAKRNIASYSKLVSEKLGTNKSLTHKIITQCIKNMIPIIKSEDTITIDDCITIFSNKAARTKHFKQKNNT